MCVTTPCGQPREYTRALMCYCPLWSTQRIHQSLDVCYCPLWSTQRIDQSLDVCYCPLWSTQREEGRFV